MKRITKKDLVKAVEDLINQYELNEHSQSTYACPLCMLYNKHKNFKTTDCGKCLNTAFSSDSVDDGLKPYGCIERGIKYPNLSFCLDTRREQNKINRKIVDYYERILVLINETTIKDIKEFDYEFRAKIVSIADLYI